MAKLFFKPLDLSSGLRQVDISSGVGAAEFVSPGVEYNVELRMSGLYADEGVRQNDDYLYLAPSPTNMMDRIQTVETPVTDGNVDLVWNKYPNYAALSRWEKMQAVIAENKANGHITNYDTIDRIQPIGWSTSFAYSGCVCLPDGNVLAIPYITGTRFALIDPEAKTSTIIGPDTSSLGLPNGIMFQGGLLLNNNKVLLISRRCLNFYTMDLNNFSLSSIGPSLGTDLNEEKYSGGTLLPDGRAFIGTLASNYEGIIFDYLNQSWTSIPNADFGGTGQLLTDGKILINAYMKSIRIINPLTSSITNIGNNLLNQIWFGFALIDNEHVFVCPAFSKYSGIINTTTLELQLVGSAMSETIQKYNNCVLLPDGRIYLSPYQSGNHSFFNLDDYSYTHIPTYNTSDMMRGCVLTPSGKIVSVNISGGEICNIISASDGNYGALPDLDTCLSAYLNKF